MILKQISNGKKVTAIITTRDHNDTDIHGETERQISESTSRSVEEAPPDSMGISPDPRILALLEGQRKDIDRILRKVGNLQQEMRSMTKTLNDLEARPAPEPDDAQGSSVSTEDLDVLTKIVTQHSRKLNGVDGLQLEIEMMRRRIKRVEEASSRAATISPKTGQFARMTGSLARRPLPKEKPKSRRQVADVEDETVIEGTPDARERDDTNGTSLEPTDYHAPHAVIKASARDVNIEIPATAGKEVAGDIPPRAAKTNTENGTNVALEDLGPGEPFNREISLHTTQDTNSIMDDVMMVPQTQADSPYHPSTAQSRLQSVSTDSLASIPLDELDDFDFLPEKPATASPVSRGSLRGRGRGSRRSRGVRRSLPVRLPTPEWEKEDWAGVPVGASTYTFSSSRGRVVRRGGNGLIPTMDSPNKRQKTESILSSGTVIDGRLRDEEGFLLKSNGQRDGRSANKGRRRDM